jgi:formylglycine-generating enzyme required for sulfatase activity
MRCDGWKFAVFCGLSALVCGPAGAEDAAKTNLLGMQFSRLPAGEFTMGSGDRAALQADHPFSSPHDLQNESPPHRVKLTRPFEIGAHEVTVGQFRKFVEVTGYRTTAERASGPRTFHPESTKQLDVFRPDPRHSWREPGFPQTDRHPVTCVSWQDAVAFCQWLSDKDNAVYRLPTEAEWEYACRAGSDGWYTCGDAPDKLYRHANVADAALEAEHPDTVARQRVVALAEGQGDGFVYTAPVGSLEPNSWGLYDMHGNVWEWCSDKYDAQYYESLVKPLDRQDRATHVFADPRGPADTPQHEHGDWRSLRGGSWYASPISCRSAARAFAEAGDAFSYTGFRVVRELAGR